MFLKAYRECSMSYLTLSNAQLCWFLVRNRHRRNNITQNIDDLPKKKELLGILRASSRTNSSRWCSANVLNVTHWSSWFFAWAMSWGERKADDVSVRMNSLRLNIGISLVWFSFDFLFSPTEKLGFFSRASKSKRVFQLTGQFPSSMNDKRYFQVIFFSLRLSRTTLMSTRMYF